MSSAVAGRSSTHKSLAREAGNEATSFFSVRTNATSESSSVEATRCRGFVGSIGRYAPPAFQTPNRLAIRLGDRSRYTATSDSSRTPASLSDEAIRFAFSFSRTYVTRRPAKEMARASGCFRALSSNCVSTDVKIVSRLAPATAFPGWRFLARQGPLMRHLGAS